MRQQKLVSFKEMTLHLKNETDRKYLKVSKSRKKDVVLDSSKKTNAWAFLCTEKCPGVRFLEESRTP